MTNKIVLTILLICNTTLLTANAETNPFSFLGTNSSARASALSGAFVSFQDDVSGVFYNPALLNTITNKRIATTFQKHVLDINSGNIVYLRPKYDFGNLALSANFLDYGSFDRRGKDGTKSGGTFGGQNLSINFAYANEIDTNFYYGVTLKYIYSSLDKYGASAFAIDAGLLYKYNDRTNIGVSILNSGMQLTKFNGETYNLPLDIRAGFSHRLKGLPILFNFSFHHLADSEDNFFDRFSHFAIGGEIYFGKYVIGRLGYDNKVRNEISPDIERGLSGFSGGIGVNLNDFNIDYSINKYGADAIIHRFSLSLDI